MSLSAVVGGSMIFEAVQRGDTERVVQLIEDDRTILRQKGWGGFTALHFAALHGNRTIAELLLSSGADSNIPCDAGQTPFHFACRHGNIGIMHKMVQHGADLAALDLQGKTSLHHAVSGGSIVAMQYLSETTMFRFSDGDHFHVTPLHIAASMGNTDVVRYLLRNNAHIKADWMELVPRTKASDQRCAADTVDQQGATALHVAAEKGMIEVCWLLLQSAGFHILHMKNHTGFTPLDLCNQGTTFRHQQLSKILSPFFNKPKDQKPSNSYVVYYWMLLVPSLSGVAVLLIAAALGEYGGVFCGLFFPWVAKVTLSQYHRMSSYQRLPNPIYLGTLAAGIIHSLVCFYYKILPSIWPAYTLFHVSALHFCVLLGLFWKVLRQNPGQLRAVDADHRFASIAELVEANQNPSQFCIYCELFQVDNCKHCRLCDFCVMDYDHHCLFLNHCVGRDNHRTFVLFILAMIVGHLFFISSAVFYLYRRLAMEGNLSWTSVAGREVWVLLLLLLNLLTLVWQIWLLSEQFVAISSGSTTYFRHSHYRKPSWSKRLATVLSFLIEGKSLKGLQQKSVDL